MYKKDLLINDEQLWNPLFIDKITERYQKEVLCVATHAIFEPIYTIRGEVMVYVGVGSYNVCTGKFKCTASYFSTFEQLNVFE